MPSGDGTLLEILMGGYFVMAITVAQGFEDAFFGEDFSLVAFDVS